MSKRARSANVNERLLRRYHAALASGEYYEALELCRTLAGRMGDRAAAEQLLVDAAGTFARVPGQETAAADLVADFCATRGGAPLTDALLAALLDAARAVAKPDVRAAMLGALLAAFDRPFRTLGAAEEAALDAPARAAYAQQGRVHRALAAAMCDTQRALARHDLALHYAVRAVDPAAAGPADPACARVAEVVFAWAQAGDPALEWDLCLARAVLAPLRRAPASPAASAAARRVAAAVYTLAARLFRDQVDSDAAEYVATGGAAHAGAGDAERKRALRFDESPLAHFVQGTLLLLQAREAALAAGNAREAAAASAAYRALLARAEPALAAPDAELLRLARLVGDAQFPMPSPSAPGASAGAPAGGINFGNMVSSLMQSLLGGGGGATQQQQQQQPQQ